MHTKDVLAEALRAVGLSSMADKAAAGYYHDYLSPLDTPCLQLAHDLKIYAEAPSLSEPRRMEIRALLERHIAGEFDATHAEGEAWAKSLEGKQAFAQLAPEGRLGDAPIDEAYRVKMNAVAAGLDDVFNGEATGPDRKVGFVLLVFPFGDAQGGRTNFISNGADRRELVVLFKEMMARFEGQAEVSGRA